MQFEVPLFRTNPIMRFYMCVYCNNNNDNDNENSDNSNDDSKNI